MCKSVCARAKASGHSRVPRTAQDALPNSDSRFLQRKPEVRESGGVGWKVGGGYWASTSTPVLPTECTTLGAVAGLVLVAAIAPSTVAPSAVPLTGAGTSTEAAAAVPRSSTVALAVRGACRNRVLLLVVEAGCRRLLPRRGKQKHATNAHQTQSKSRIHWRMSKQGQWAQGCCFASNDEAHAKHPGRLQCHQRNREALSRRHAARGRG
jgi:hypothetical protein